MEHQFKVGDRVRRTAVSASSRFPAGLTGVVYQLEPGWAYVHWDGMQRDAASPYELSARKLEPADAPQPQAEGLDGDLKSVAAHQFNRATRAEEELARAKELAVYWKGRCDSAHAYALSEVGDLKGERDRLKAQVVTLEGDVAYWQREAIRLGGKARGSR